jgi:ABC-2 type transport system permease protein
MESQTKTVAYFEFRKTLKRVGFWVGTLIFPVFIILVGWVSYFSAAESQRGMAEEFADMKIALLDETNVVIPAMLPPSVERVQEVEAARERVQAGELDAFVHLPLDLGETKTYEIYAQQQGIIQSVSYQGFVESVLRQSALARTENVLIRSIVGGELEADATYYDETGEEVEAPGIGDFALPIVGFMVFFIAVFIGAQYLLQSVSEEKENRMIESILSVVSPRELINGKIIGLSLVILVQLLVWVAFAVAAFFVASGMGIDFSQLPLDDLLSSFTIGNILLTILFIVMGFLLFASIMVGVGSVATNQRESQQLSSIFIISAILPVYFAQLIITQPTGTFAQFFTYFPFTSPLMLMLRNAMGEITTWELVLGISLNAVYVALAFWIAGKLFQLGMLMYNRRPTSKEILSVLRFRS